jgi:hypothetical protein
MTNATMNITAQIHQYLTTAASSHFLQQAVTLSDHWSGRDNLLWRVDASGQEAVLKLFLDAGQARGRRQLDGQERFAPWGIAPRPIWFDRYPEGLSRQVLIYAWVPGEPVNPAAVDQGSAVAHSIAQVHRGNPAEVRRFCPNPVNLDYWWRVLRGSVASIQQTLAHSANPVLLEHFDALATNAEALVTAALPLWAGTPPTPVHGDLRLENVIHSFGIAVLLDWELFGLGDPALEVANFLHLSQAELDEATQTEWLEHYLAQFDQPGLGQRIAVYRRLLPFQGVCFLLGGWLGSRNQGQDAGELTEAVPFLSATLQTTWQQAGQALSVDVRTLDDAIQNLFLS